MTLLITFDIRTIMIAFMYCGTVIDALNEDNKNYNN